jgi:hypothetical protein
MAMRIIAAFLLLLALAAAAPARAEGIVVNGVALSREQIDSYQIAVPAGRYWYDSQSGLWGAEGGPSVGYIPPALPLGGPLRADASGTGSGVFINGREIHGIEVLQLMDYFGGPIQQGRYWLGPDGVGGVEGQQASFSLFNQDADQGSGQGSGKMFEDEVADFCARNGGCPW